jgi:metal-responsive CopG/Arc/MetJ family transcriptional regulator
MKTAISIPDEVFERAEHLARRTRKSRSQLYSDAVNEYVSRHAPEEVTEAMDRVIQQIGTKPDKFVSAAARRRLAQTEW